MKNRRRYATLFEWPSVGPVLLSIAFILLMYVGCHGQDRSREYQVKAIFLYNFTQFVEWPSSAFPEKNSPLIIGVLGQDPFGAYLDETVKNEKIGEHPLVVNRFTSADDIGACHILFVNIDEKGALRDALNKLAGRPILTVGDADHFIRDGGMVRFVPDHNKIRMQINLEVARETGLLISSKLLRLAEIVSSKK